MFKFKMLTKVLVAVLFYGTLIELNLNLTIALSIDLGRAQTNRLKLTRAWRPDAHDDTGGAQAAHVPQSPTDQWARESASASRTPASDPTTTTSSSHSDGAPDGAVVASAEPLGVAGGSRRQTLESNGRVSYFGKIYLGAQRTPFMVLFDLTSSAFWLTSSECQSVACLSRQQYNASSSRSHEPDGRQLRLVYGLNGTQVSARLVRDRLELADGLHVDNFTFAEALELSGDQLRLLPVDGFFGLGFRPSGSQLALNGTQNDQSVAPPPTPLEQLLTAARLEPVFSMLITSQVNEYAYSADNGQLLLGAQLAPGYTQAELTYVPVTGADFWEFRLDGVALLHSYGEAQLESACESRCPAILDTGTPYISGHYTDIDRLNKAMGAYPIGDGLYRLSHCDLGILPRLVFAIGGHHFSLQPDEYVTMHRVNGNVLACFSALRVVQAEQYPFWILGEHFLKRHYVVFDYGQRRLGFAASKAMARSAADTELDIYGRRRTKQPTAVV